MDFTCVCYLVKGLPGSRGSLSLSRSLAILSFSVAVNELFEITGGETDSTGMCKLVVACRASVCSLN